MHSPDLQQNIKNNGNSGDVIWLILIGVDIAFFLLESVPMWFNEEHDHREHSEDAGEWQASITVLQHQMLFAV